MPFTEWLRQLRKDPRGTPEEDLWILLGGVGIILICGVGTTTGYHARGDTSTSSSPQQSRTIVAVVGIVIVIVVFGFGFGLAIVNVTMWRRSRTTDH